MPCLQDAEDTANFDEEFVVSSPNLTKVKLNKEMKKQCDAAFFDFNYIAEDFRPN